MLAVVSARASGQSDHAAIQDAVDELMNADRGGAFADSMRDFNSKIRTAGSREALGPVFAEPVAFNLAFGTLDDYPASKVSDWIFYQGLATSGYLGGDGVPGRPSVAARDYLVKRFNLEWERNRLDELLAAFADRVFVDQLKGYYRALVQASPESARIDAELRIKGYLTGYDFSADTSGVNRSTSPTPRQRDFTAPMVEKSDRTDRELVGSESGKMPRPAVWWLLAAFLSVLALIGRYLLRSRGKG